MSVCARAKSVQSCLTLCNSAVHQAPLSMRILQARTLEWVALPSSRGSSRPKDQTDSLLPPLPWQAGSLPLAPPGKPVGTAVWKLN